MQAAGPTSRRSRTPRANRHRRVREMLVVAALGGWAAGCDHGALTEPEGPPALLANGGLAPGPLGINLDQAAPVSGGPLTFTAVNTLSGSTRAVTYAWTFPDSSVDTGRVVSHTFAGARSGQVRVREQEPGSAARVAWQPLSVALGAAFTYAPGSSLSTLGATFSRASVASYTDSAGFVRLVASGVPRDRHTVGGARTLLLEGPRTNAWGWSEALDNAAWTKAGASVTANVTQAVAPDSSSSADLLLEANGNAKHAVSTAALPGITPGLASTYSFYARSAGRTLVQVAATAADGTRHATNVNLSTCGLGAVRDAALVVRSDTLANGWCRLGVTFPTPAGSSTPVVEVALLSADVASATYGGDRTKGALLWGLQFEANGRTASSYIATPGAAAGTRAADALAFPWAPAPQAMTVLARYYEVGTSAQTATAPPPTLWQIGSSTAPATSLALVVSGGAYACQSVLGGAVVTATPLAAPSYHALVEARAAVSADGALTCGLSLGGGSEALSAASPGPLPSAWGGEPAMLMVGGSGVASGANALALARLVIRPYVQPLATMRPY